MKKLLALTLLTGFLFIGCQDDSSVLAPDFEDNNLISSLDNSNIKSDLDDLDVNIDRETKSISIVSKTFTVDGKIGAELIVSKTFIKDGERIIMAAELEIPQGAFEGKLTFDMIFDFDNYSLELYPSPFTFDKPVLLDLLFKGVDFNEFGEDELSFDYLDGESESLKYENSVTDEKHGLLKVEGVELHHFSRYGWTRTKPGA